jgi:hypothetical protein
MKLSEAIRAGAQFGDSHGSVIGDDGKCGCAIGSSFLALGLDCNARCPVTGDLGMKVGSADHRFQRLAFYFPVAKKLPLCPVCDGHGSLYGFSPHTSPGGSIECLFENHKWSKKAIAEWVEVIENKLEGDKQEGATGDKAAAPPACASEDRVQQEVYPAKCGSSF